MPEPTSFGSWLKARRRMLDLTQQALGERVGCAAETIRRFEAGRLRPSRELAARLAYVLGLPVEEHSSFIDLARRDTRGQAQAADRISPVAPAVVPSEHTPQGVLDDFAEVVVEPADTPSPPTPVLLIGTVTFLLCDIESSARFWEQNPDRMRAALLRHDELLATITAAHNGTLVATRSAEGSRFAAFARASDAVHVAAAMQRTVHDETGFKAFPLRVRIALHTGEADQREGDYFGPVVNRCGRICSVAHPGQTLLSQATVELVQDQLPAGATLRALGVHRLTDLTRPEHVFQLVLSGLPSDFPPLHSLDARPMHLPVQLTSLVGREREVATLRQWLSDSTARLITLTGAGGTGKTRLAVQVAAEMLDGFTEKVPDGVWFVNLAPITDASLVATTIAQVLDIREAGRGTAVDSLKEAIRDKQMLLVLDNFEQVLDAAPLVAELLSTAPGLIVLVTSRIPLHVGGEQEFPVPPLALPPVLEDDGTRNRERGRGQPHDLASMLSQYEAVRLFIERARAAKPDFKVTNENAPAVAEICARLDGLPLAIELAAARSKFLSPQVLLSRLGSRLKLLVGGARDLPARQQTLRNTIEWSYSLLDEGEQQLFSRLAVFVGGCTLEAVEAVCGGDQRGQPAIDPFEGLLSLVDKSLLRQDEGPDDELRFVMLETIHEYARERLEVSEEAEVLQWRYARYYLDLVETIAPELMGAAQASRAQQLEMEHGNLRSVLTWTRSTAEGAETGLRLTAALWRFWEMRGHFTEGRQWLEAQLARGTSHPRAVRAKVLDGAGVLTRHQGEYARAIALHQESLALAQEAGDMVGSARSLAHLAMVAHDQGDYERAKERYTQAFALGVPKAPASAEEATVVAQSYNGLGKVHRQQGDFDEARAYSLRALELSRGTGNRRVEAEALSNLGVTAYYQRNFNEALVYHSQALEIRRAISDRASEAMSLSNLAMTTRDAGDYSKAQTYFSDALTIQQATGNRWEQVNIWMGLGSLYHELGDLQQAQTCLEQGLALSQEIGDEAGITYILANLGPVLRDRGDLDGAEKVLSEGLLLAEVQPDKPTMSYFLSHLASVSLAAGNLNHAIDRASSALALRREIGLLSWTTTDLATLAATYLARGEISQALSYAREALTVLHEHRSAEPEFYQRDYFECYRVFSAAGQSETAYAALHSAISLVMTRAATISDPALRQSFLDQVPVNRLIRQEAERVGIPAVPPDEAQGQAQV